MKGSIWRAAAVLALCAARGLCSPGPENVLLVVNDDSKDSVAVATTYADLRHIPAEQILHLSGAPTAGTISLADFKARILQPILAAIRDRGLQGRIDAVIYSAGFPYAVDISPDMAGKRFPIYITQPASLTGLTYLYEMVLRGDTTYLSLDANWYAVHGGASSAPSDQAWTEDDRRKRSRFEAAMQKYQAERQAAEQQKRPVSAEAQQWLEQAAADARLLAARHRANAEALYDLACTLALQGRATDAVAVLEDAFRCGWRNAALMAEDPDLSSLRARPDFQQLVRRIQSARVDVGAARPFHATTAWGPDGKPTASGQGRRYLIAAMLAYIGGPANTLDEALASLRASARADGSRPAGTIYFMVSTDVARTGPRRWAFRPAAEALQKLGVRAEVLDGVLPPKKPDVAGAVIGIANFNWQSSGSTILPGAFCDHLTSAAGVMSGGGQTLLSEYIRHGAAGSCGTVWEPYNLQAKFPTAFLQVYYASGCTLAEAFYQSVACPYQQLLVGDPLCRPWARIPSVRVAGLKEGELLRRPRTLAVSVIGSEPVSRLALYVDGKLRQTGGLRSKLLLDPAGLAPGMHEARVVATAGPLESTGRTMVRFRVGRP